MPTFETPDPIDVDVEVGGAYVRIEAADRTDTVVEVTPTDPSSRTDRAAAQDTRVELVGGRLEVRGPSGWRGWTSRRIGAVDVRIDLPAGSTLRLELGAGSSHARGRLGACRARLGAGDLVFERVAALEAKTGAGDISVEEVAGSAQVTTGTGEVRIDRVDGTAAVKDSNGSIFVGEVTGDARFSSANGSITVDRAMDSIVAKTARGDVRIGEVSGGVAVAQSSMGTVEVGVLEGVAAWLDLHTKFGRVRKDLDDSGAPEPADRKAEVHASTSFGDITIRRAPSTRREAS
jgi:hypothetical protein